MYGPVIIVFCLSLQISTLKFAARMMRVANHPVKNVLQDPQVGDVIGLKFLQLG